MCALKNKLENVDKQKQTKPAISPWNKLQKLTWSFERLLYMYMCVWEGTYFYIYRLILLRI